MPLEASTCLPKLLKCLRRPAHAVGGYGGSGGGSVWAKSISQRAAVVLKRGAGCRITLGGWRIGQEMAPIWAGVSGGLHSRPLWNDLARLSAQLTLYHGSTARKCRESECLFLFLRPVNCFF